MFLVKKIVFYGGIFLCISSNMVCKERENINHDKARHYLTHVLTHYLGSIAGGMATGTGIGLTAAGVVTMVNEENQHNVSCYTRISLPTIVGALLAMYIYYKTPQWTDTYILKSDQKRTVAQNVLVMLSRIIVPFPVFNVIVGEYCAATDQTREY